jgi:hypothetical protein
MYPSLTRIRVMRKNSIAASFSLILVIIFSLLTAPSALAAECIKNSVKQNGYIHYAFTTIGTCDFTLPVGLSQMDYLVVAGGGGGGSRAGGGGGGGGLRTATDLSLAGISSLSITIGDGGAGGPSSRSGGITGGNSTLIYGATTVTSTGGGGGHDAGYAAPTGGASSGGGTGNLSVLNLSVSGQGNLGGSGVQNCGAGTNSDWCGGGGGGAGTAGGSATSSTSGAGGSGSSISWITSAIANTLNVSDTSTGTAYFSGGGSGGRGSKYNSNVGTAGVGGGGLGAAGCSSASCAAGAAGKNFTGGGGGGGGYQFSPTDYSGAGGKGGSGVVVLRFLIPSTTFSTSVSANVTYKTSSTITTTLNIPGRITFLANGKRIPGCISLQVSLTAQCNWKPSTHGRVVLTQTLIPTSSVFDSAVSSPMVLTVVKRGTAR